MFTRTHGVRAGLLLSLLAASPASAEVADFFGHKVLIAAVEEGGQSLTVDGKQLATADMIFIEKSGTVGGVDVLVTSLHIGGSFCAPQPTLVTFEKGKPAQTVAPADTNCRQAEVDLGKEKITFSVAPSPSQDGVKWTWTPASGVGPSEKIAFQPDPQKSWANLRSSTVDRPAELFRFGDIGAQIRDAVGADVVQAVELLNGNGSGAFKGDAYVGTSCMPHRCDEAGALVFADVASRRVFVAWKAPDKQIVVRPAVTDWPQSARLELKNWAKPWYGAKSAALANGAAVVASASDAMPAPSIVGPDFEALHGVYKGEQGDVVDHNGSWMLVFPRAGLIVYDKPKTSIADVVRKGDVLFRGEIGRRAVRGTAYVFKSGCAPEPYAVRGNGYDGSPDARLVLKGAAPVRAQGCAVTKTSTTSGNATLVFKGQGEFGDF